MSATTTKNYIFKLSVTKWKNWVVIFPENLCFLNLKFCHSFEIVNTFIYESGCEARQTSFLLLSLWVILTVFVSKVWVPSWMTNFDLSSKKKNLGWGNTNRNQYSRELIKYKLGKLFQDHKIHGLLYLILFI